jgi:hypothetical protein
MGYFALLCSSVFLVFCTLKIWVSKTLRTDKIKILEKRRFRN